MRVNHVEYDENLYTFDELSEAAKEKVKQWWLDDSIRNDDLYDIIMEELSENFPHSELKVQYDLGYSQGDGLNIYGRLHMDDFLPHFDASEESKTLMSAYINELDRYGEAWVELSDNRRYGYSMKFIDAKDTNWLTETTVENLENSEQFETIDAKLIESFYSQLFTYMESLDHQWEKFGYEYLYEISDEEMADICDVNGYEFYEDGRFAG